MRLSGFGGIKALVCYCRPDISSGGSARPAGKGARISEKLLCGRPLASFVGLGRPEELANILVVEDDLTVRAEFQYSIKWSEFSDRISLIGLDLLRTSAAAIAEEIIAKKYDCLVMDGKLISIEGADIVKILRQRKYGGWIIANSERSREALMAAGADLFHEGKSGVLKDFFRLRKG